MKKILVFFMALVLLVSCALPTFANNVNSRYVGEENLPTIYTFWKDELREEYPYAYVINNLDHPYVWLSSTAPTVREGTSIRLNFPVGKRIQYSLNNGDEDNPFWYEYNRSEGSTMFFTLDEVIWASHDLVDSVSGSVYYVTDYNFFPMPLWETILLTSEGEMKRETIPTMVSTMNTLVLCGVGLMACLAVLSLFGKRSLLFRR